MKRQESREVVGAVYGREEFEELMGDLSESGMIVSGGDIMERGDSPIAAIPDYYLLSVFLFDLM
jgi:hypothetical protein